MLTKTQEQVCRQAQGPQECVETASCSDQRVAQAAAIHLRRDANDPSQQRSVVCGEPESRYRSLGGRPAARRHAGSAGCASAATAPLPKIPLQQVFVMKG